MKVAAPLLLALAGATAPTHLPPPPVAVASALPDWQTLPRLRYQRSLPATAPLAAYVRAEVDAGRCASVSRSASSAVVRVDMAVLVGSDSGIRRIVPRAIGCMTVEQYAAGLVSKLARDNVDNLGVERDTWFRTTLIFAWPV